VQFVGNRGFTFRAQRATCRASSKLFFAAEAVTLGLNCSVFQLLIRRLHGVAAELVRFLGTGLVLVRQRSRAAATVAAASNLIPGRSAKFLAQPLTVDPKITQHERQPARGALLQDMAQPRLHQLP
jgi:hypothetical protein